MACSPGDSREDMRWECRAGASANRRAHAVPTVHQIVGCDVQTWPEDQYTAHTIAGEHGEQIRRQLAAQAHRISQEIIQAAEGDR
jgi:hypothetical protein